MRNLIFLYTTLVENLPLLRSFSCLWNNSHPPAVRERGGFGQLPLHDFVAQSDYPCQRGMQLLIDRYPDSVMTTDDDGMLPFHRACESGDSREVVELLMDSYRGNEADHKGLNVTDNNGCIPLHYAVSGEVSGPMLIGIVQFLLNNYPEGVGITDNSDMLPLHRLCTALASDRTRENVRVLLEANPYTILQENNDRMTPLQLAFNSNHRQTLEIRQFLLEKKDQAYGLLQEAFVPTVEYYNLPILVVIPLLLPKKSGDSF